MIAGVGELLARGVSEGAFPGGAAVVLRRGREVHASAHGLAEREPRRRPLGARDLFDLASLTKLYVASAAARLVDRGELDLDAPAARWLPSLIGEKASVTIRELLAHASGLPAWRPWWKEAIAAGSMGGALGPRRAQAYFEAALAAEPLEAPPGARACYSDLGFMALGFALERLTDLSLDALLTREVLSPLSLTRTLFLPLAPDARAAVLREESTRSAFVATRRAVERGGEVLCGVVDDDNAWALGGVAGHAGLFAPASEVAAFGGAWLEALAGRSGWLSARTAHLFTKRDGTPGSERALGWDTPSALGSTLGSRLGRGALGAVGHLGFTGTSLWLDLDQELVCALLTNHVHPDGPDRPLLRSFRARFHDAVAEGLGLS